MKKTKKQFPLGCACDTNKNAPCRKLTAAEKRFVKNEGIDGMPGWEALSVVDQRHYIRDYKESHGASE